MATDAIPITREHVGTFIAHLLATKSPATAADRYRALEPRFALLVD